MEQRGGSGGTGREDEAHSGSLTDRPEQGGERLTRPWLPMCCSLLLLLIVAGCRLAAGSERSRAASGLWLRACTSGLTHCVSQSRRSQLHSSLSNTDSLSPRG